MKSNPEDIRVILHATDLSHNSNRTLQYAITMAEALNAKVRILHVVEGLSEEARITLSAAFRSPEERAQFIENRHAAVREVLEERHDRFWNSGQMDPAKRERVESLRIREGFPVEVILKESEDPDVGLILMGAHAQGISHTFLGQTAKRVLRRSRKPTMIVPSPAKDWAI